MNIIVVIKQTFDTEEKIMVENGQIVEDGAEFIINPYDEYAVEEAIRLREQMGGEVTAITVGPSRAESALRTALAMGADKAIMVEDEQATRRDGYAISKMLAAAIKDLEFDLILAGNMSIDNGASQVGPRLAEELGVIHFSAITKLSIDGSVGTVTRDLEGDEETAQAPLPFLATAQQGLNEPRYPTLPGIMKAKRKPLTRLRLDDLNLSAEDIEPKMEIVEQYPAPNKKKGRMLSGDLEEQARELTRLLRDEAKVI